jgi:hypothetical protein
MSYVDLKEYSDVTTVEDLMEFVRSRYGVIVAIKEKIRFRGQLKEFLADNPHLGDDSEALRILAKAVEWGKRSRRKCTSLCGVFYLASYAFASGALPELDPDHVTSNQLETDILDALSIETDNKWRTRLIASAGSARVQALQEWRQQQVTA